MYSPTAEVLPWVRCTAYMGDAESRLRPKVCLQRWGKLANTTLPLSLLHGDLVFKVRVFPFLHRNWINLSEAAAEQKLTLLPTKSSLCTSCTSTTGAQIFPLPTGEREVLHHHVTPFDSSDFFEAIGREMPLRC